MISRIVIALIWVPLLLVVLFLLPPYFFTIIAVLICTISTYELMRSVGKKGNERITIYSLVSAAIIPVGAYFEISEPAFLAVALALMVLTFFEAMLVYRKGKSIPLSQILITLFGGAIMPLMISTLVSMRNMPDGSLFVLVPVISAFLTDGGAYFIGVFLGKHKAFPNVSPNKTIEGCVGGLLIGTIAMVIYGVVLGHTTPHFIYFAPLVLYGLVGSLLTQFGDLAFSLVKREFDIKDYGRFLAGHGGVLDRFDSMVFTAPAMYLLVLAFPPIIIGT